MSQTHSFTATSPLGRIEVYSSTQSYLEDVHHPGETLVICFSGQAEKDVVPTFEFFEALHWLETDHRTRVNKFFMRDIANNWYHLGIPGIGDNVDEVAAFLRQRIDLLKPRKVITLGNSMGGYAAILFGALLDVDQIIALCPRAFLDTQRAIAYNDMYYYPALHLIERHCEHRCYYPDLPHLLQNRNFAGKTDIFIGSKASGENATDGVSIDTLHAAAFYTLPKSTVHAYPSCGHDVARYMKQQNIFDRHLASCILGAPAHKEPAYEGRLDCISNNLLQGWVWDRNNPEKKLEIEVLQGDEVLFSGKAHAMRTDHEKSRREEGLIGFYEWLPDTLWDGKEHKLSVRVKGSDYILPGSPLTYKYSV